MANARIKTLVCFCLFLLAMTGQSSTISLTPVDDAIVLTRIRTQENWGASPLLEVYSDSSVGDFSFLRFNLSGISGTISSMRLRLYPTIIENAALMGLFYVANDNWAEGGGEGAINTSTDPTTGITGANFGQPILNTLNKSTARLATAMPTAVGTEIVFSFVKDMTADRLDGFLTLMVALDTVDAPRSPRNFIRMSSSEGSYAPILELEIATVPELSCWMFFLCAALFRPFVRTFKRFLKGGNHA